MAIEEERVSKVIKATDNHTVVILKPIIDKVRITFSGLGVIQHIEGLQANEYWEGVYGLAKDIAKDDDDGDISNCRVDGYRIGLRVDLGGGAVATFGFDPRKKTQAAIKLEFNPAKFTLTSVKRLFDVWKYIEGGDIPLAAHLTSARITRCDVAVDVLNLRLPDVFVYCPDVWKTWICTSLHGGAQTINFYKLNKSQSPFLDPKKRANVVVYDKKAEQKAFGKEAEFGDIEHTRIEFQLNKTALFKNLINTQYPAKGWSFCRAISTNPPFASDRWLQFLDSARFRGYVAAEKLLSADELAAMNPAIPNTTFKNLVDKSVWEHWPEALDAKPLAILLAYADQNVKTLIPTTVSYL